jgi:hypothetical protein
MTNRYLVHAYGAETQPIAEALRIIGDFAQKNAACRDVALCVYSLQQVKDATTLARVLTEPVCRALRDKQAIPLPDSSARLRLLTERMISKSSAPHAVLAVYAHDSMLEKLERLGDSLLVVAVPWNIAKLEKWIAKWRPQEIGAPRQSPA